MDSRLTIPKHHIPGFAGLRDAKPTKLRELADKIAGGPVLLTVNQLRDTIGLVDDLDATAISELIVNLALLSRRFALSTLISEEMERWSNVAPGLEGILASDKLVALAKSIQLRYDQNLFTEASVVTDVRPIFDREATALLGSIVCHSLRVTFAEEGGDQKNVMVSVDARDLQRLIDVCQRALIKERTLKAYLAAPVPLPAVSEEKDGS
jgi:hypothetical protein